MDKEADGKMKEEEVSPSGEGTPSSGGGVETRGGVEKSTDTREKRVDEVEVFDEVVEDQSEVKRGDPAIRVEEGVVPNPGSHEANQGRVPKPKTGGSRPGSPYRGTTPPSDKEVDGEVEDTKEVPLRKERSDDGGGENKMVPMEKEERNKLEDTRPRMLEVDPRLKDVNLENKDFMEPKLIRMMKDMVTKENGRKMMILVEPGEGVAPRRRGRGRGKKWTRENVMNC